MKNQNIDLQESFLNKLCEFKIIGNVQIGSKGQIVIPKDARDLVDLKPWDELVVIIKNSKYIGLIKSENLKEFFEEIKRFIDSHS